MTKNGQIARAGSSDKQFFPSLAYKTMGTLKIATLSIRTLPHQRREHIGVDRFDVGAVVREAWKFLVLLAQALLLLRDSCGLS